LHWNPLFGHIGDEISKKKGKRKGTLGFEDIHIFHVISSISFFAYVSLISISLKEIYISICGGKKKVRTMVKKVERFMINVIVIL